MTKAVVNTIKLIATLGSTGGVMLLALMLGGLAQSSGAAQSLPDEVTVAAAMAQQRCYEFMHEDADEFVSCIDALSTHASAASASATAHSPRPSGVKDDRTLRWRRLGILYFGWVGANNSARVALPGADAAAARYFQRYQRERRALGIDEPTLCTAVAGDCTMRLAQIKAQQRQSQAWVPRKINP